MLSKTFSKFLIGFFSLIFCPALLPEAHAQTDLEKVFAVLILKSQELDGSSKRLLDTIDRIQTNHTAKAASAPNAPGFKDVKASWKQLSKSLSQLKNDARKIKQDQALRNSTNSILASLSSGMSTNFPVVFGSDQQKSNSTTNSIASTPSALVKDLISPTIENK